PGNRARLAEWELPAYGTGESDGPANPVIECPGADERPDRSRDAAVGEPHGHFQGRAVTGRDRDGPVDGVAGDIVPDRIAIHGTGLGQLELVGELARLDSEAVRVIDVQADVQKTTFESDAAESDARHPDIRLFDHAPTAPYAA